MVQHMQACIKQHSVLQSLSYYTITRPYRLAPRKLLINPFILIPTATNILPHLLNPQPKTSIFHTNINLGLSTVKRYKIKALAK